MGRSRQAIEADSRVMRPAEIRRIREKLGLNQVQAGYLLGPGRSVFWRYEVGEVTPSVAMSHLLRILDQHPALLEEIVQ